MQDKKEVTETITEYEKELKSRSQIRKFFLRRKKISKLSFISNLFNGQAAREGDRAPRKAR